MAPVPATRAPAPGVRAMKALRIAAHFGHAVLLVVLRFPAWSREQRLQRIQRWSQQVLASLQIQVHSKQPPRPGFAGLVVANHLSWLDILVLQSLLPGVFIAKSEVRRWPVVGFLAAACATIFVNRSSPRSARAMVEHSAAAMAQGDAVIVFPEGTSSNGEDLGSFHANIFESAIRAQAPVQLLTLKYLDTATGEVAEAAHFVGDMSLLSSLQRVIGSSSIQAHVQLGECLSAQGHSRKSLAQHAHQKIRASLLAPTGPSR